ncbi:MAG: NTP transferase domain-containing protein [candidate division Zixibacteria bacterium]|jgi:choline kinase|nr:NTP transferase domain-containing protein [candidate division Zixibacteria bacterium]
MKVVIIAAGLGSRLWEKTEKIPKTLLPYNNGTILSNIIANFNAIGINNFIIVVGYQARCVENYTAMHISGTNNIEFVTNPEWERGNGISVLAAERLLKGKSFILSMSDHIVSPTALRRIADTEPESNYLLVDPGIDAIFDIDDATKVKCEGSRITDIGKRLTSYNAIDCGVFKLTNRYFSGMKNALLNDEESISAAIKNLIKNNDMNAVFMSPTDRWIDIDTPEAYKYILSNPI